MKKLLFIAIMVMLALPSMAQIKVGQKSEKIETLYKFRGGTQFLKKQGPEFYFALNTSNRFDDYFIISLGNSPAEAVVTAQSIYDLALSLDNGETVPISDIAGREMVTHAQKAMGAWVIYFDAEGYAGTASLMKGELEKVIKFLEKQK